jgi:uncharacterized OB-fold protein
MTSGPGTIRLEKCGSCQSRFLPTDGPCPRCGSTDTTFFEAEAIGRVLAATELLSPPAGWRTPLVLAFVEMADAVRVLAVVDGSVPVMGSVVALRTDGDVYRARTEPIPAAVAGRGEGESPRAGATGPSFEPPR